MPFNGPGDAATPVAALMKRALDRGLYLMTHWNVVMGCPPLTITREELDEALDILDDALTVADEFVFYPEPPSSASSPRRPTATPDPGSDVTRFADERVCVIQGSGSGRRSAASASHEDDGRSCSWRRRAS